MAELLVRLVNNYEGDDLQMIAQSSARGDVIVAQEDGHQWGSMELASHKWVIIKVPIPRAKALTMCTPEFGDAKTNPYLHARSFFLDLDVLGLAKDRVAESITITEEQFDSAKRSRLGGN